MSYRKKLIEVALPLEAINRESAKEKSIRHGHPSTLHLWWARRPLASCRAVLFASIVDDPSSRPNEFPGEEMQQVERERLFRIIEELVKWDNSNNEQILEKARAEIRKATGGNLPRVLDPFCGGGSIPLEAQRLGLEVQASDLNPVAVLITKALIEIPPKFANLPPVNPKSRGELGNSEAWDRSKGFAEDVRYYGNWMRDEAERRIGHLYPKVRLPKEHGGGEATVIAWLWARTVQCPNPACGAQMPLVRSFWLSTKANSKAWVEPVIDTKTKTIRFDVRAGAGAPPDPPKVSRGAKFRCLVCKQMAEDEHIKAEGMAGRIGAQLMAVVAQGARQRTYLPPTAEQAAIAASAVPGWGPDEELPFEPRAIWCTLYGVKRYRDLFTSRQLVALTTFSDLIPEARQLALRHAQAAGLKAKEPSLAEGGDGADAYAAAIAVYLAFALDKAATRNSNLTTWYTARDSTMNAFSRQAIPMTWDFAEVNPLLEATGSLAATASWVAECLETAIPLRGTGRVAQLDAVSVRAERSLVITDPPYYDNVGYADLSDFFYVWLRRSLRDIYPDLFSTLLTPKTQELIASPYRFNGDRGAADRFFEEGLRRAFDRMREIQDPSLPMSMFYAFRQAESDGVSGVVSTGWETMLTGLLAAGLSVTGTWPMRTEQPHGLRVIDTNALASSILLVCRPRAVDAPLGTRHEFVATLKAELPRALRRLQQGNIAPVDLAQAAIGPGMAVFSKYAKVMEADGTSMRVRAALGLINQVLDEVLAEQESEYDPDTRWAVAWYDQYGTAEGPYGAAETLSKAKNTSVSGLVEAGVLRAKGGKVRLLRRDEFTNDWNPAADSRFTVWEATQYLIRSLEMEGEAEVALLARKIGPLAEVGRDLAYRLYATSERRGWAQDALAYNSLVVAWPEISRLVAQSSEQAQTSYL